MVIQTEYEFTLPKGFVDDEGGVHRDGTMRLATGADEIRPMTDPRVKANPKYAMFIVLSRVITRLGSVGDINPRVTEGLFVEDLAFLQELYDRVNNGGDVTVSGECPVCSGKVEMELTPGECVATPSTSSTGR